jgi:hypothetical protein
MCLRGASLRCVPKESTMPSQIIHLPCLTLKQIAESISRGAANLPSDDSWRLHIYYDNSGTPSIALLAKPMLLCPNRRPPFQEYVFALLLSSATSDLPQPRELPRRLVTHLLGELERSLLDSEDLSGHERLILAAEFATARAAKETTANPVSARSARGANEHAIMALAGRYQRILAPALPQLARRLERYRRRLHASGVEAAMARLDWQAEIGAALVLRPTPGHRLVAKLAAKSRRGDLSRLVHATQNQLLACTHATLLADPWAFSPRMPIGEAELQSLHTCLTRYLLPAEKVGAWRQDAIGIHSPLSGKMIAQAAPAEEVPGLVTELIAAFEADRWTDLSPLIRAAMFHVRFEKVHPFADGNGRVGRMTLSAMLSECRWPQLPINIVLYWRRRAYLDALTEAAATGDDLPFLLFLLKAVGEAIRLGHQMLDTLRAERWRLRHALAEIGHDPATTVEVCDKLLSTLVAPNYAIGLAPARIHSAISDSAAAGYVHSVRFDGRTGYVLPAVYRLMRRPVAMGIRECGPG